MRSVNHRDWTDEVIASHLAIVRREITELENERGALIREQSRRVTEVAQVKRRLTSG